METGDNLGSFDSTFRENHGNMLQGIGLSDKLFAPRELKKDTSATIIYLGKDQRDS